MGIGTPPDGRGLSDSWDTTAGRMTAVEVLGQDLAAVVTRKVMAAWDITTFKVG